MDLVSSNANIQYRLINMSLSSLIRGTQRKFSDIKYMFEEAKLSVTNFYTARKAKNVLLTLYSSKVIKVFLIND